jgi:ADP-ribose pyrophosphatase
MSDELDWPLEERIPGEDLILFRSRYDMRRHPHSRELMKRIVLESVDWVNVVALAEDGQAVMIRQFRFGVGYTTLEIPGGMVDPGESPETAARRELAEETGCSGGRWSYLGAVEPNPAVHDNLCHHFLAEGVVASGQQALSGGEAIRVEFMSLEALTEAARSGEIKHALALSALSRVFELWPRPFVYPGPQAFNNHA